MPLLLFRVYYRSSNLFNSDHTNNYGSSFPIIVQSGLTGKIAYYAKPPEQYSAKINGEEQIYYSIIENMYYGMLE